MTTPTTLIIPISGDPEQVRRASTQLATVEAHVLEIESLDAIRRIPPALGPVFPFGPAARVQPVASAAVGRIHSAGRGPRYRGVSPVSTMAASLVPLATHWDGHERPGRTGRSPLPESGIDVCASAETTIQHAAVITENS
jgi:hypothetical protein